MTNLINAAGGLVKALIQGFLGIFGAASSQITKFLNTLLGSVKQLVMTVPHPITPSGNLYGQPAVGSAGPWHNIYGSLWKQIIPLSLFLLLLVWGVSFLAAAMGAFLSNYEHKRIQRRVILGFFGINMWWFYVATITNIGAGLTQAIYHFIHPTLSNLVATAGGAVIVGAILSVASLAVIFGFVFVYACINLMIFSLALAGPILIVFWAANFGPMKPLSQKSGQLLKSLAMLSFIRVPAAFILYTGTIMASGGVVGFVIALATPALAGYMPIYFFRNARFAQGVGETVSGAANSAVNQFTDYGGSQESETETGSGSGTTTTSSGGSAQTGGSGQRRRPTAGGVSGVGSRDSFQTPGGKDVGTYATAGASDPSESSIPTPQVSTADALEPVPGSAGELADGSENLPTPSAETSPSSAMPFSGIPTDDSEQEPIDVGSESPAGIDADAGDADATTATWRDIPDEELQDQSTEPTLRDRMKQFADRGDGEWGDRNTTRDVNARADYSQNRGMNRFNLARENIERAASGINQSVVDPAVETVNSMRTNSSQDIQRATAVPEDDTEYRFVNDSELGSAPEGSSPRDVEVVDGDAPEITGTVPDLPDINTDEFGDN